MGAGAPKISIVIAGRNAGHTLTPCLRAISESHQTPDECIVVDDASTDGSADIVRRFEATLLTCAIRGGPAKARNLGAECATGDLLIFLDADVCVHPDTVGRILEHFQNEPPPVAVIGSYDDNPTERSFISQYRNLLHCFTHRHGRPHASTFWCGCGAIWRAAFLLHGGLPETYDRPSVEDIAFGHQLGASGAEIRLDPRIVVTHLKRWSFLNMVRTDVWDRAIPWTRLIFSTQFMPDDLNLRIDQRASVGLAFAAIACAVLGHPIVGIFPVLALILLNRAFYAFLWARRGAWFAIRAVPLHLFYYLYSGVAFCMGAVAFFCSTRPPELKRIRPEAPNA